MNHRLTAPAAAHNPFHLYYPFISPAPYLPAIAASSEASMVPKARNSLPPSVSTPQPQKSSFSISRILQNVPPSTAVSNDVVISSPPRSASSEGDISPSSTISIHQQSLIDTAAKMLWLQQMASAQHHPILSRPAICDHKKVAKKRKLGRNPRIPFTQQQIELLEERYSNNRYLSSLDVVELSKNLELSEARVKIWFQNRRARARRDEKLNKCMSSPSLTETPCMMLQPAVTSPTPMLNRAHQSTSADNSLWKSLPSASSSSTTINNSLGSLDNRRQTSPLCKLELLSDTD